MKGNKKPKNKRRLYINKKYIHIYKKERAIIIEPLLYVDMSAQGSRGPRALAIITWLLSHCQSFTKQFLNIKNRLGSVEQLLGRSTTISFLFCFARSSETDSSIIQLSSYPPPVVDMGTTDCFFLSFLASFFIIWPASLYEAKHSIHLGSPTAIDFASRQPHHDPYKIF